MEVGAWSDSFGPERRLILLRKSWILSGEKRKQVISARERVWFYVQSTLIAHGAVSLYAEKHL